MISSMMILLAGLISADLSTGVDGEIGIDLTPDSTNYSEVNVNNSDYWDGLDSPANILLDDLGDTTVSTPSQYGILNWDGVSAWVSTLLTSASNYLSWSGLQIDFDEVLLNETIDARASAVGGTQYTDVTIDITSSHKNNVVWDISEGDAENIIIQPEAEIINVFGGEVK